jgi:hypothetical protein
MSDFEEKVLLDLAHIKDVLDSMQAKKPDTIPAEHKTMGWWYARPRKEQR